jgi:hypothetical protein
MLDAAPRDFVDDIEKSTVECSDFKAIDDQK